jgi:hypothetical protein
MPEPLLSDSQPVNAVRFIFKSEDHQNLDVAGLNYSDIMTSYSVTDYLLDRANIHDTVSNHYMTFDRGRWGEWDKVLAPELILDYTSMFGGEPRTVTPSEIAKEWKAFADKLTSHQHIMTTLIIHLPQPGSTTEKVMKATVEANVIATLTRKGFEGGEQTSNGGILDLELTKISDLAFGNPWRISKFKANMSWYSGNTKVLSD